MECPASRQHTDRRQGTCATGAFLSTAVPPSIFNGLPAMLPTGTDGHGGTAASTKFYELRDNLWRRQAACRR